MLFRQTITRWVTSQGKRTKANAPGAKKITTRSRKWYADLPARDGKRRRVALCASKAAALSMLAELLRDDAQPAWQRWGRVPLCQHLDDFERELRQGLTGRGGRAPCAAHVRGVMDGLRALLLDKCALILPGDLELGIVRQALHALALPARAMPRLPVLPEGRAGWSLGEVARLLGTRPCSLYLPLRRYGIVGTGPHAHRTYTAEQVLTLARRQRGRRGLSPSRLADLAKNARRFSAWLLTQGRLPRDPLTGLTVSTHEAGERHGRRSLSGADLAALLLTTQESSRTLRKLTGRDRHALYLTALSTGLRRGELARLTPEHFRLGGPAPHVVLPGSQTKNGAAVTQPLPAQVVPVLRAYLAGRESTQPVWPGPGWARDAADVLRRDLADAGVTYFHAAPEGDLFADFHALRHTFIALLDRAGVSLKQAMQLARHSDPRLTARVYGRATLNELAQVVDAVGPSLVAAMVTATPIGNGKEKKATGRNRQQRKGTAQGRKCGPGQEKQLAQRVSGKK